MKNGNAQRRRRWPSCQNAIAGADRDRRPRSASRQLPEKPAWVWLGHLEIVVIEADDAEAERHAQHDPHIGVGQVGPQQRRRPRCRTGSSARPWSACRSWSPDATCGPSARIGWPLPCCSAQHVDDRRAEQEHEHRRGHHRAAGAERDVAKHVEERERVRKMRSANKASAINLATAVRPRAACSG